jgi:predicted nucleic acid-binding protein
MMILADTSVWVDHFRRGSAQFGRQLENGEIAMHTVVLGELATGNLRRRSETLAALQQLPYAREGRLDECLAYLEAHPLYGRGLGWNDIQLLVAAELNHMLIWSLDRQMADAAEKRKLRYK